MAFFASSFEQNETLNHLEDIKVQSRSKNGVFQSAQPLLHFQKHKIFNLDLNTVLREVKIPQKVKKCSYESVRNAIRILRIY